MVTNISKRHQQIYDAIFHHPMARHLNRRDVTAMLAELATVTYESNGNTKVIRNDHTLVLHASRDKNISEMDELMSIRRFLEDSALALSTTPSSASHMLVVMDHREARIYKTELRGEIPQRIIPLDSNGSGRYLHGVEENTDGKRKPETKSFYEDIAKVLQHATGILLFGSGTGASSAMEALLTMLKKEYPRVANHIVGTKTLDVQHLSEDQLLALARDFYQKRAPAGGKAATDTPVPHAHEVS